MLTPRPELRGPIVVADRSDAAAALRRPGVRVVVHASQWPPADPAAVLVSVLDGEHPVTSLLPPYDLGDVPDDGALALVPGATISVGYRFVAGPFGPVDVTQRFQDGRLALIEFAADPAADVFVEATYRNFLRVRLGECSVIEALDGGRLVGEPGPLSVLAGLLESPEYDATWQANRPVTAALASVADLFPLARS